MSLLIEGGSSEIWFVYLSEVEVGRVLVLIGVVAVVSLQNDLTEESIPDLL